MNHMTMCLFKTQKSQKQSAMRRNGGGFSVVEIVITIGLLSFGVIGIYSAFSTIATLHTDIAYRFTAAYLAQEGVEIVRNMRDYNFIVSSPFAASISDCSAGCQLDYKTATPLEELQNQLQPYGGSFLNLDANGLYSYDGGSATPFRRAVTVTLEASDVVKVSVLMTWEYKGVSLSYQIHDYLYNWN